MPASNRGNTGESGGERRSSTGTRRRRPRFWIGAGLLVVAGVVAVGGRLYAQMTSGGGTPDPAFGQGGRVFVAFPESAQQQGPVAVALAADGKMVLGGTSILEGDKNFALVRLNADGSLDSTFGEGGLVMTTFPNGAMETVAALVVQGDGRILVGGTTNAPVETSDANFALIRYDPDGMIDTSFGVGGGTLTTFPNSAEDQLFGLALQPDGKIVAVGQSNTGEDPGASDLNIAVVRYQADGLLDTSFGRMGGNLIDVPTGDGHGDDSGAAVAIQPDGKIVVAGATKAAGANDWNVVVLRHNVDGTLDPAFGVDGLSVLDVRAQSQDEASAVAVQPDGKIVVVGKTSAGADQNVLVLRLGGDGAVDAGFGGSAMDPGRQILDFAPGAKDEGRGLAVAPDGKIVIVGITAAAAAPDGAAGPSDFALVRLGPEGVLDPTFGDMGRIRTDLGGSRDEASAVVIQPDGKVGAAGVSNGAATGESGAFAVVRYLP